MYRGSTLGDGGREHHRVVFTVTDLTKVVDGVRTLVIWDRDYSAGELVETELAMFAQDTGGNVWHFGQYPEEYEEGEFVKAPAWVAGFRGARTGIAIKQEPNPDGPSYSQGYAPPPLNWDDRARVYQVDTRSSARSPATRVPDAKGVTLLDADATTSCCHSANRNGWAT